MADERLIKPLMFDARQTPRDSLPRDWADSLRLDYLGRNESTAEIAQRLVDTAGAVYALQQYTEIAVAAAVSDAAASGASASFDDIAAAGATYAQAYAQGQTDAIMQLKAQFNLLVENFNALVVIVNQSLQTERDAGLRDE